MKTTFLRVSTAIILMLCLTACDSSSNRETQHSAQEGVIEASIGTVEIEGLEIALPCAYAALPISPASDESKWLAPQESHYAEGMLDQQICFKVSEASNCNYVLYCAFPEDGDYHSGVVYSLNFDEESNRLTYQGEQYIFGETTEQEIEARLGTSCDMSETGMLRNYTYEDGVISVFMTDGKLTGMIVRSRGALQNQEN